MNITTLWCKDCAQRNSLGTAWIQDMIDGLSVAVMARDRVNFYIG